MTTSSATSPARTPPGDEHVDGLDLEHVLVVPQHDGVLLGQGVAHLLEIKVVGLK